MTIMGNWGGMPSNRCGGFQQPQPQPGPMSSSPNMGMGWNQMPWMQPQNQQPQPNYNDPNARDPQTGMHPSVIPFIGPKSSYHQRGMQQQPLPSSGNWFANTPRGQMGEEAFRRSQEEYLRSPQARIPQYGMGMFG